jgi:hypothetical protein
MIAVGNPEALALKSAGAVGSGFAAHVIVDLD